MGKGAGGLDAKQYAQQQGEDRHTHGQLKGGGFGGNGGLDKRIFGGFLGLLDALAALFNRGIEAVALGVQ